MTTKSEAHPELTGVNGLQPWLRSDSSPRGAMFGGHIGQALVIDGVEPRRCLTGAEREYGKYTFSIKMPVDAEVIKLIERYPRHLGADAIKENPESVLIYEDVETKEVGCLFLRRHFSLDKQFGFKYTYNPAIQNKLSPGNYIAKGTVIADTPAKFEGGEYGFGTEAQVAFMSIPQVIEDGVVVRRGFLDKLKTRGFESRTVSWGKKLYPLNLYGDEDNYKPFPDIGDRVREDGLVMALRPYDEANIHLGVSDMTRTALMEPDTYYDKLVHGRPGARVTDVVVYHDINQTKHPTPVGMEVQAEKYRAPTSMFYENILNVYYDLKKRRKESLKLSPDFHRLLVEAKSDKAYIMDNKNKKRDKVTRVYRNNPIDDWRVEVHYEYDIVPTEGFKVTDCHGGKGVIVDVWDDSAMPVDKEGKVADFIMDGDSTVKRMNIGRMYEQYLNATSYTVSSQVRKMVEAGKEEQAKKHLLGYYQIVSPVMANAFTEGGVSMDQHVKEVVKNGVYLYLPPDNPVSYMDAVRELRVKYPTTIAPVVYTGRSGVQCETVKPVLIGSLYLMLLEKTGEDWSGVSSTKLQHFGIPAKLTNADKYSAPGRQSPVRFLGETEVRLLSAFVGSDLVADLLDQSNNPQVHKEIVNTILKADNVSQINRIIDRKDFPIGRSRTLEFLRHMLQCAGIKLVTPKINT